MGRSLVRVGPVGAEVPAVVLREGDVVALEIDGLGRAEQRMVQA